MKSISLITILILILTSCTPNGNIISSDPSLGTITEDYYYMDNGELYLNECALVYTTNLFKSTIDYDNGLQKTVKAKISSGSQSIIVNNGPYNYSVQSELPIRNWQYGDTLETIVEYTSSIRFSNMFNSFFTIDYYDLYLNFRDIDYNNQTIDLFDYTTKSCLNIYFQTIHNEGYTGRLSKKVTNNKISTKNITLKNGKQAVIATAQFDILEDFAKNNGIESKKRSEIIDQIIKQGLQKKLIDYREVLNTSANKAKEALTKRNVSGATQLAFEQIKSLAGLGAPKGLIETVNAVVEYNNSISK